MQVSLENERAALMMFRGSIPEGDSPLAKSMRSRNSQAWRRFCQEVNTEEAILEAPESDLDQAWIDSVSDMVLHRPEKSSLSSKCRVMGIEGRGGGLVASEDIPEGHVIISLREDSLIHIESVLASPVGPALARIESLELGQSTVHMQLSFYLALQLRRASPGTQVGALSWETWTALLPATGFDNAANWTSAELELLRGTEAFWTVTAQRDQLREEYERAVVVVQEGLRHLPDGVLSADSDSGGLSPGCLDWEAFLFGWSCVQTRAMDVHGLIEAQLAGTTVSANGRAMGHMEGYGVNSPWLVPWGDMMNHHPRGQVEPRWVCGREVSRLEFVALCNIPKGAEIYNFYGRDVKGVHAITNYGFCPSHDKDSILDVDLGQAIEEQDHLNSVKLVLLAARGLSMHNYIWSENPLPRQLIAAARLIALNQEEQHLASTDLETTPATPRSERRAITILRTALRGLEAEADVEDVSTDRQISPYRGQLLRKYVAEHRRVVSQALECVGRLEAALPAEVGVPHCHAT